MPAHFPFARALPDAVDEAHRKPRCPNRDDLFRNYPELAPEDIEQALAFAAANLEDSASETDAA